MPNRFYLPCVVACTFIFALSDAAGGADSAATQPAVPAVRVAVDPRVELMSIIFRLAGNPEYNHGRVDAYTRDVEGHFGPHRGHPVVKLARRLRSTNSVSYDAVMAMAVHITDTRKLGERIPFDPHPETLDQRWTVEDARAFLRLARRFVKESDFNGFIKAHQPLYDESVARMQRVLDQHAHLEWFDGFFGARPGASFTVALGLLNGGMCYGARVRDPDGTEALYCVLGVWQTDAEGMPTFDRDMLGTVVHEFCHSYCNPLVDAHLDGLRAAGQRLYPPVADKMKRQAYASWQTMMRESLVRACVCRYIRRYRGAARAWMAVRKQKERGFTWTQDLVDELADYEKHRDTYPTLEAFMPRIAACLDRYGQPAGPAASQPE